MGCRPLEELDEDSHESMTQGGASGESAIETQGLHRKVCTSSTKSKSCPDCRKLFVRNYIGDICHSSPR